MPQSSRPKAFVVSTPAQLAAIASPRREEVLDAVVLMGPCSVSELARALGRSPNALYYHVRALRDSGLLIESHRTCAGVRETALYDAPGRPVIVRFDLSSPSRRAAVWELARTRLDHALKGVEAACASDKTVTAGPLRELWATHVTGWLSAEELAEVNALFLQLIEIVSRVPAKQSLGRKPIELTLALSPARIRRDE